MTQNSWEWNVKNARLIHIEEDVNHLVYQSCYYQKCSFHFYLWQKYQHLSGQSFQILYLLLFPLLFSSIAISLSHVNWIHTQLRHSFIIVYVLKYLSFTDLLMLVSLFFQMFVLIIIILIVVSPLIFLWQFFRNQTKIHALNINLWHLLGNLATRSMRYFCWALYAFYSSDIT